MTELCWCRRTLFCSAETSESVPLLGGFVMWEFVIYPYHDIMWIRFWDKLKNWEYYKNVSIKSSSDLYCSHQISWGIMISLTTFHKHCMHAGIYSLAFWSATCGSHAANSKKCSHNVCPCKNHLVSMICLGCLPKSTTSTTPNRVVYMYIYDRKDGRFLFV